MSRKRQSTLGSELVAVLERTWGAIRVRHAELPPAVIIVGSGSEGRARGLRLGHFAASRWHRRGGAGDTLGEVFVAGEGLDRQAVEVLGTLIHEAAHALAHQRELAETSRQGRYHNERFKHLAEELGVQVERHPQLGFSLTSVPPVTAHVYAGELRALERALSAYRERECGQVKRKPSRNAPAFVCSCERRMRMASSTFAHGPVICGVCGCPFGSV